MTTTTQPTPCPECARLLAAAEAQWAVANDWYTRSLAEHTPQVWDATTAALREYRLAYLAWIEHRDSHEERA